MSTILISKAYKFRLYPTNEQVKVISRAFGSCRYVYNHFLALRKKVYEEEKRTVSYYECCKLLTELKQECVDENGERWLYATSNTALQYALRDLDTAYKNFFRRVKQGATPGYPKFKSKYNKAQSYRLTNQCIRIKDGVISLSGLGTVKLRGLRPIEGKIQNVTVSRTATGKYFVSICCAEVPIEQAPPTDKEVGIDLGIKHFYTDSDGNTEENPKYYAKSERKMKHLQRTISRRKKGSSRYKQACLRYAKVAEKVANCRRDKQHKLSTKLVHDNKLIAIENLSISKMLRDHRLAKHISDASWYEFRRQLEYKAQWHGRKVIAVDRSFASSQLCSECGFKWPGTKNLGVRSWTCPNCGTYHDRDKNAAINILTEGKRMLAEPTQEKKVKKESTPIILELTDISQEAILV